MATIRVAKGKVSGEARIGPPSEDKVGRCVKCGGRVLRSWHTGILHRACFLCRYLMMIYGPKIEVRRKA